MKVLKFGGTSVGTANSISNLRDIVLRLDEPAVVVVSALGGVTDQLIRLGRTAAAGDATYHEELEVLRNRHRQLIDDVVKAEARPTLHETIRHHVDELASILQGVYLIQDLTPKTADAIVAYGERMSSLIVAALVDAHHVDSRQIVRTTANAGDKSAVNYDLTNANIQHMWQEFGAKTIVMGGFIASDDQSGRTTNLGRGGSDFTAAIVAAALDAERLEIWTDVDGFMTADPRIIKNACTIPQLSYDEAMELCNFGAKVVYPPTIFPVCAKRIPIYVRNTFRPDGASSVICSEAAKSERVIRGISSVNETSIVTVSGMSMVGVVGVNERIFARLRRGGVSVFMVAQTSSETSTSLCVTPADGPRACQMLDEEFSAEIASGAMNPAHLRTGLATIAAVGENMKTTPGIAGSILSVLGRNGIGICASTIGAFEINLSLVVDRAQLRKALNVLHDSLFLSEYEELNVFLCGTGTVGGKLLDQIAEQRESLKRLRGIKLNVVGVSGRSHALFNAEGLDPSTIKEELRTASEGGVTRMMDEIMLMNIFNPVFVDCTASAEVAEQYSRLLDHHVSIVAANKIAASGPYETYRHLKQTARKRGVKYLFETNVGAGLPIINTINDLTATGDRIVGIEAVLSGTLNYVFNTISAEIPLSKAVRLAKENGYSEPDPRIDLSGKDVIRKITILARESGYAPETSDIIANLFLPQSMFDGSLEDFWRDLPSLDEHFERERQRLAAEGKRWRFVAQWKDGKGSVGLREIPQGHPLYNLEGSNNIVCLTTERYNDPMLIKGYGAGADVTAAGVFADIMRCV